MEINTYITVVVLMSFILFCCYYAYCILIASICVAVYPWIKKRILVVFALEFEYLNNLQTYHSLLYEGMIQISSCRTSKGFRKECDFYGIFVNSKFKDMEVFCSLRMWTIAPLTRGNIVIVSIF